MGKKYLYEVLLKDAVSDEKRKIAIETTSMLSAILAMDELKNKYEYILKVEIKL
jgi:hypothetical protein